MPKPTTKGCEHGSHMLERDEGGGEGVLTLGHGKEQPAFEALRECCQFCALHGRSLLSRNVPVEERREGGGREREDKLVDEIHAFPRVLYVPGWVGFVRRRGGLVALGTKINSCTQGLVRLAQSAGMLYVNGLTKSVLRRLTCFLRVIWRMADGGVTASEGG